MDNPDRPQRPPADNGEKGPEQTQLDRFDARENDAEDFNELPEDLIPTPLPAPARPRQGPVRKTGFILGWVFLLAAFAAGAAETVVRVHPDYNKGVISAHDLWYTLDPSGLVGLEIRAENVSPFLWDPILMSVLLLPAWVLCLLPGALLLWRCWPKRPLSQDEMEELQDREATLFLYDDLAREAEAQGFSDDGVDDMLPIHERHHYLDEAGVTHAEDETAYDIAMENEVFDLPPVPEDLSLPPSDGKA